MSSVPLMVEAFGWVRDCDPIQPLTSGIWLGDWSAPDLLSPIQRAQTGNSDIITFHNYGTAEDFVTRVKWLSAMGRPILCTEFMARPAGSTVESILPPAKELGVGAFCWWESPGLAPAHAWFHDLFDEDGTPHDPAEIELLRLLTAIDERTATMAGQN